MHLEHLKTTSFAEHKALGGYYDGIVDLADKFAEVYFGRFKRVEIVVPEARAESSVEHMKKMQQIIDADRNMYPSELQNIMDEMLALVNKTLYLLTLV
ncbi:MAG: hypothetical protein [Podoviridae sp. ctrTa16]|nr:MAG: hypothetical protein [Podoviridae sp. ctrTa16]